MSTVVIDRSSPSLYWTASNSAVMIGRGMRHSLRNVETLLMGVMLPLMLLLLFVYVFGGAIEPGGGYINYVVPGIILLCAGFGSATTAVSVSQDMTEGVMDRFRSMPIVSSAVFTGHVVASLARNLFSSALVIGVAMLIGFRPHANVLAWVGAAAMIALFIVMMSWVAVLLGLVAKNPEAASGFTFMILFLPYLSSAFVPVETMPAWLRGFAEYQPVTPIIETVRALLLGTPVGNSWIIATAWCVGILAVVIPVAAMLFRRKSR